MTLAILSENKSIPNYASYNLRYFLHCLENYFFYYLHIGVLSVIIQDSSDIRTSDKACQSTAIVNINSLNFLLVLTKKESFKKKKKIEKRKKVNKK